MYYHSENYEEKVYMYYSSCPNKQIILIIIYTYILATRRILLPVSCQADQYCNWDTFAIQIHSFLFRFYMYKCMISQICHRGVEVVLVQKVFLCVLFIKRYHIYLYILDIKNFSVWIINLMFHLKHVIYLIFFTYIQRSI